MPFDHRVEEVESGLLGSQELVGIVQVLPGLCDRAPGVVVEAPVLVTGDDVTGLESGHLVDRPTPGIEASDHHRFAEILVSPVVDDVPGHDQPESRHV